MRILIAVEDEQFGSAILDFVTAHLWQAGTMFRLVHVVEPTVVGDQITAIYGSGIDNEILAERIKSASALLSEIREKIQAKLSHSFPVEVTVMVGRAHHTILDIAEEWKADMIVMGSHGRKGFSRFLLGSVSLSVVSHANCAITIVRLPKDSPTEGEIKGTKVAKKVG